MKNSKTKIYIVFIVLVSFLGVSCRQIFESSQMEPEVSPDTPNTLISKIIVFDPLQEDAIESSLLKGQTVQLAVRIEPENATVKSVVWSIDTTIEGTTGTATIDQNGLLSGVEEGVVFVIATATDVSGVVSKPYKVNIKQNPFILIYKIPADGIENFPLPLSTSGEVYDLEVDWGDGSDINLVRVGDDAVHNYEGTGTPYTVEVAVSGDLRFGDIDGDGTDDGSWGDPNTVGVFTKSNAALVGIKSFGEVQFINNIGTFANIYRNFTLPENKEDIPYLEGSIEKMFAQAWTFDQSIDHFDITHVTRMFGVFYNARAFNQNLSKLDVQHVSNLDALFLGATAFNQDMSGWTNWKQRDDASYTYWLVDTAMEDNEAYQPPGF